MPLDPDKLLQRIVDSTAVEVRRLRAAQKHAVNCPTCGQKPFLSESSQKFLISAGKLMADIAFGARKLLTDKTLRALGEGQLDALENVIKGDKPWMPPTD